jgi:hypothetical protein
MPTPPDPAALVRAFLDCITPTADRLPDPFSNDGTSPGPGGHRGPPVRLRSRLARLVEDDRHITRSLARQRGAIVQECISSGTNSTMRDSKLNELFRNTEAERSSLRERWYSGLSPDDRAAVDDLCLAVAGSVVRSCFPPSLPPGLHGSMARLALEYAAVVRRAATERQERERSLANRGLGNRTVVESILRGVTRIEAEATSRLIGRWFGELTPEQQAALDGKEQQPAVPTGKNKRKRRRQPPRQPPPLTPEQVEAMQLVGEHKGNITAAAKQAGKSRQAMVKLYKKACQKIGQKAPKAERVQTRQLPKDRRGQVAVADPREDE